jgi:hypothetical protein
MYDHRFTATLGLEIASKSEHFKHSFALSISSLQFRVRHRRFRNLTQKPNEQTERDSVSS